MTQEDKAKAYDEMVQRVKELHETGNFLTKKQMEIICPELAESEDERIRKWLVTQMQKFHAVAMKEECWEDFKMTDAAVAYLERQKETHYTKRNALFDSCVENCDPEVMKRVSDEIDEMLEKEQKTADDKAFEEWIDDWWKHNKVNNPDSYDKGDEIQFDEKGFKNFCRGIRNMYQQKPDDDPLDDPKFLKGFDTGREVQRIFDEKKPDEIDGKALLHVSNKSYDIGFRDGVASVKPADWSEEDEKIMQTMIKEGDLKPSEIAWLKSLPERFNLRPKVEWSEEDEKMLARIIERGKSQIQMFETGLLPEHIDWLKSLRPQPHWKPSEEQIKVLKWCRPLFCEPNLKKVLESLIDDLEKLM